jgi:phage tail-like protein
LSRPLASDLLQNFKFWLIDVSLNSSLLLPVFGFSAITSPNIIYENIKIQEGNSRFPHVFQKKFEVDDITMSQGEAWSNSDFWNWVQLSIKGINTRKNLVLLHLAGQILNVSPTAAIFNKGKSTSPFARINFEKFLGKAYIINNAVVKSYKAGSDFDSMDSNVSIQQLTISYEYFLEISPGSLARAAVGGPISAFQAG